MYIKKKTRIKHPHRRKSVQKKNGVHFLFIVNRFLSPPQRFFPPQSVEHYGTTYNILVILQSITIIIIVQAFVSSVLSMRRRILIVTQLLQLNLIPLAGPILEYPDVNYL